VNLITVWCSYNYNPIFANIWDLGDLQHPTTRPVVKIVIITADYAVARMWWGRNAHRISVYRTLQKNVFERWRGVIVINTGEE
jgi:hypothetical protein